MTSPPFANKIASAGPVASNALQDASLRRRVVSAATLVVGSGVLAWSLRLPPGDALFYPGTLLLALTWIGGARLSGPLPRATAALAKVGYGSWQKLWPRG